MAGDGGRRGYISHTAVSPAYQRRGIGNGQRGSFYVLIIETSKNGKNILRNAEVHWIYCR